MGTGKHIAMHNAHPAVLRECGQQVPVPIFSGQTIVVNEGDQFSPCKADSGVARRSDPSSRGANVVDHAACRKKRETGFGNTVIALVDNDDLEISSAAGENTLDSADHGISPVPGAHHHADGGMKCFNPRCLHVRSPWLPLRP